MTFAKTKAFDRTPAFRRGCNRGAALAEYALLLALLGIAAPLMIIATVDYPEFPDTPVGGIEVPIEYCVIMGSCPPPTEAVDFCIENTAEGQLCSLIPWVPISPPDDPTTTVLVPVPDEDPELMWATTLYNERFVPSIYANRRGGGSANHTELVDHAIDHPAAQYCETRGLYLPPLDEILYMQNFAAALQMSDLYHSSSQRASTGFAPSSWWPLNYTSPVWVGGSGEVPTAFPTQVAKVRCAFR